MIMDESPTYGLILQMNIPTNRPSAIPWNPIVLADPSIPWTPIVPADPAIPLTPIVPYDKFKNEINSEPVDAADTAVDFYYDKFKNEINSEPVDAADTAVDFYCC
jgi:hypothetical protein